MYGMIRTYTGTAAKQLFEAIMEHKEDVEKEIRTVAGLVSYTLIQTSSGGHSITVCEDKQAADASARVAKEWIQKNLTGIKANPPTISEGPVALTIS
jgi:hypothetical protein